MENFVFSVYDRKAQYYLPPFASRSEAEAVRAFVELVMNSETPISQYPADFDLMQVGTFNLESGGLNPVVPVPRPIINGLVALTDAQRERQRYQTILSTVAEEEPLTEAHRVYDNQGMPS